VNKAALLALLALLPTQAVGEVMVCYGVDLEGKAENGFRIEAEKDQMARVWYAYDVERLDESPADVLEHHFTGIKGSDGLGISSLMIRQRDENGNLLLPALLTIDWTTNRLAAAYVPFLSDANLLVVRTDYQCQRLD
jgi:hypothetical protein